MNKPSKRSNLFLLLAALILLSGCGDKAAQQDSSPPPPPEVSVVTLKTENVVLKRELPARITPYVIAEVRPQVSGIIEERLFVEGGPVEAGEHLYQLDDATYQANYNRAEAQLKSAEATWELAKLNADRAEQLFQSNTISAQNHDTAQAELKRAEAAVALAKAELEHTSILLDYSRITSPISGIIGKSAVTQGALVVANQTTPLATVQQLDPIYVDLKQSSRELLALRKDLAGGELQLPEEIPVSIILEDGTPYNKEGKVAFSEVTVDPTTGSYSLRAEIPNPDSVLLPGMYVRAVLSSGVRENAILVPQQAIARTPTGDTTAMVVNASNLIEVRPVKVSRTIGDKWLVESGLEEGDRVVVAGLQKIRPGVEVKITEN